MNGGNCVSGRCVCLEGMTGTLCETPGQSEQLDKVAQLYSGLNSQTLLE